MNHIYPNFFITHEREGRWHELQPGRDISKCLSGTCPRYCLLAARGDSARLGEGESARGDQHSIANAGEAPYCAWLVPLEGEPLGHFEMVEGGKGEIGRVYNPYVIRSHLPSAQIDHPLSRAYAPTKHAALTEFYRRGHKASYYYAKAEDRVDLELGREEEEAAMKIFYQNPEWVEVFKEIAKDFLWVFNTKPLTPPRSVAPILLATVTRERARETVDLNSLPSLGGAGADATPSDAWKDVSQGIGGHNGEYDWKCQACGYTTWFARNTDPNKEGVACPDCEKEKAP